MKRTLLTIGLAALLTGLVIAFPVYAQNNKGRIEGRITNLTTGGPPAEPLPSVEVLVNEWMALRSGREGEWNVTGLPPGVYSVRLNLPPGYSPAQAVITATIWGDNTEVVNLAYYEGSVPLPTPAPEIVPTTAVDERVQPLGAAPAATTAVTPTIDAPAVFADIVTPTTGITAAAALPGQAGVRSGSWSPAVLALVAGLGLVIAAAGAAQLWRAR